MFKKMCIIGVGLIGGSIARASKKNNLCEEVIGVGRSEKHLQKAVELGVIDGYELSIPLATKNADIIVICSPVGAFESIFQQLKTTWSKECLYTDAGSTKASVLDALENVFAGVPSNFVPAHPIAGSENNGVEASSDRLFEGKRSILTPTESTDQQLTDLCQTWWEKMGAEVSIMSPRHHDEVFAATSHLPHVLAFSLVEVLKNKQDEREIFEYAAGGFKDFTRIASSDPEMWADICLANGPELLNVMKELEQLNQKISSLIDAKDKQGLLEIFKSAQSARKYFLSLQKK
ncbi:MULTISPECIES: prephenate dehydrogenase [Cycloclasticus]|jgi:prephenate dehydrogenase|uniref:prephenate dehydrogenase n=1 Tax=Cycloclasticus zancles 78-ME TaxID=1198232 RepID=S5T9E2_9GAMM|nr:MULTISPECIES: prephenate dehydrogenase/arogenate dehydrogenase family protein [Cycloclasticus]AGS40224.1 Prephenate dehydrogenase [Cycloclasticus zancles 78-ME]MBV1898504.1 prephenate dehydrogenase/arogenate dehydrogenase family protein [Cycloclasticus sp.]